MNYLNALIACLLIGWPVCYYLSIHAQATMNNHLYMLLQVVALVLLALTILCGIIFVKGVL